MAFLMQIESVDGQLAEALWDGGVETLEELSRRELAELREHCTSAHGAGKLPAIPDDATLAILMRDAALLQRSGALTGTIRDQAGNPIQDADVRLGYARTTTDPRGRFRLTALPLGGPLVLTVEASGFRRIEVEDPGLEVDPQTVVVRIWQLEAESATSSGSQELSSYDGDRLPRLAGQWMTSKRLQRDEVREGDLLTLRRIYDGGEDAELVSKFPNFRDDKFVYFTWRIPLTDLPSGAARNSTYRVVNSAFVSTTLSPRELRAATANRRWRKAHSGVDPQTMDVDAVVAELIDAMNEEGLLQS